MSTPRIFDNVENWNFPIGKLIKKFEDLISNVEDIEEEYHAGLNKEELLELKSKANRNMTYLDNLKHELPRDMTRILNNTNLKDNYSINSVERLKDRLFNVIKKVNEQLDTLQGGKKRKSKKNNKMSSKKRSSKKNYKHKSNKKNTIRKK
jgi:hypothetical protein